MDQLFLKDKYTKSNYSFMDKNQTELKLTDAQKLKVDKIDNRNKERLTTLFETLDFSRSKNGMPIIIFIFYLILFIFFLKTQILIRISMKLR